MLKYLKPYFALQRRSGRTYAEHEQAILRLVLALAVLGYVLILFGVARERLPEAFPAIYTIAAFAVPAIGILTWVSVAPDSNRWRRCLGITVDIGGISALMLQYGETMAPLYIIYLWVIVGNALRFGQRELWLSTVLALLGFAGNLVFGTYWSAHRLLGTGLLLGLLVIPSYLSVLVERLRRAHHAVRRANEAKSEFLARMSHEIRTPLNGMLGMVPLIADARSESQRRDVADTLNRSGSDLLRLVNEVLDFSKLEAGCVRTGDEPFDVHELLQTLVTAYSARAWQKGLRLFLRIDPNLPYRMSGDAHHLRQALANLLSNAVKFTDRGHVTVDAVCLGDNGNRTRVRISVIDTGIGVAPTAHEHIFDSYAQADGSITRRFGGTGLGTTIARQLVELMGGTVTLTSSEGVGSTFTVSLELARCPAEAHEPLNGCLQVVSADPGLREQVRGWAERWNLACEFHETVDVLRAAPTGDPARRLRAFLVDSHLGQSTTAPMPDWLGTRAAPKAGYIVLDRGAGSAIRSAPGATAYVPWPAPEWMLYNAVRASRADRPTALEPPVQRPGHLHAFEQVQPPHEILVVDDNAINRKVVTYLLEKAGHAVMVVDTASAAACLLQHRRFDLMLTDLHLPDHSGADLVRTVRNLRNGQADLPVLVLTADLTERARQECRRAGANGFLTKPVMEDALLSAVAEHARTGSAPFGRPEQASWSGGYKSSRLICEEVLINITSMTDGRFVRALIDTFIGEAEGLITRMENAVESAATATLIDCADALRGNAAQLGAEAVANVCAEFAGPGTADLSPRRARELMSELRAILGQSKTQLVQIAG